MLRSFIFSDVYRVMLGCANREALLEAIGKQNVNHHGALREMTRADDSRVFVVTLFVDGEALEVLSLQDNLEMMQIDNISARLRAVPTLPRLGDRPGTRVLAPRAFGCTV